MNAGYTCVNRKGKWINVPSVQVCDRTVVVNGKWIRMATVYQEEWMEEEPVQYAEDFIEKLKKENLKADIFSFSQRLPETTQKYKYHVEWDNAAAIPITNYENWWQKRLSRRNRQEVKRAERLGVIVKRVSFDEDLIRDIVRLFNQIETKQGTFFVHHGKDYATVKRDLSSYLKRSEFVGAYFENVLIGYIKIVFLGKNASILNIISNDSHFEKRPNNSLIAEAVKICAQKGMHYLQYGKYIYGNKTKSTLTEFKRRNGFEKIVLPRYYIPFTLKGKLALRLKLHLELVDILPESLISFLLNLRSGIYKRLLSPLKSLKGSFLG